MEIVIGAIIFAVGCFFGAAFVLAGVNYGSKNK